MTSALSVLPQQPITISMPSLPTIQEVEAMNAMCKIVAFSGFISTTSTQIANKAADAFFVMMMGREIGIPPMMALKTIYVIDGKPSCSGQALLSLMRKAKVRVEVPDPSSIKDTATIKLKRPDSDEWKTYSYTLDMAKDAGLVNSYGPNGIQSGKKNWNKHWREMLIWRAVAIANRFETPDITGGLHTIEELNPDIEVDDEGTPLSWSGISSPQPDPKPLQNGKNKPPAENKPADKAEASTESKPDGQPETAEQSTTEQTEEPKWYTKIDPSSKSGKTTYRETVIGWCRDQLSLSDRDILRLAKIEALDDVSQETGWGQYDTGAAAWKAINDNLAAEIDASKSEDKTPKNNPGKDAWTDFDEHTLWELANDYGFPERQGVLAMLEVENELREYGTPAEVRARFTELAIEQKSMLTVRRLSFHQNFTNLYCGDLILRVYGREIFRSIEGGEINTECENWQKGKMYSVEEGTLTDTLLVLEGHWSAPKKENAGYFEVEKGSNSITLADIPW